MRKFVALAVGAVYLAFGLVAVNAHLHEVGDHGHDARGLHLHHAHLGGGHSHAHGHDHGPAPVTHQHDVDHHGDVAYLSAAAARSSEPQGRSLHALPSEFSTFDPGGTPSRHDPAIDRPPADPPVINPARPRAPPA